MSVFNSTAYSANPAILGPGFNAPGSSNSGSVSLSNPAVRALFNQPTLPDAWVQAKNTVSPFAKGSWKKALAQNIDGPENHSGETLGFRLKMMGEIKKALPKPQQKQLESLLKNGTLTQTQGDDAHSTLYYLYQIITLPRAAGLNPKQTLAETVDLLAAPYSNGQDFSPLGANLTQQVLDILGQGGNGDPHNQQKVPTQRTTEGIQVKDSNTCAASAQVSRLASRNPKEFARMVAQASSPTLAFTEQVKAQELLPEAPAHAETLLQQTNMDYQTVAPGVYQVAFAVPQAGLARAIAAQQAHAKGNLPADYARGIESLLQTTLVYNATGKSYDPATDQRDALDVAQVAIQNSAALTEQQKQELFNVFPQFLQADQVRAGLKQTISHYTNLPPQEKAYLLQMMNGESNGLTEAEKTRIERIVEDGDPMTSVTYQVTGPAAKIVPGNESKNYLYGYTRSFSQTTQDLLTTLQAGREVIAGITFMAGDGEIPGGHEIKIQGYQLNPKTNQLSFVVADSDDTDPLPKLVAASSLIPQIHHMGLPYSVAQPAWQQIAALGRQYYTPDAEDAKYFNPTPLAQSPLSPDVPLPWELKQQELAALNAFGSGPVAQPSGSFNPAFNPTFNPPSPQTLALAYLLVKQQRGF